MKAHLHSPTCRVASPGSSITIMSDRDIDKSAMKGSKLFGEAGALRCDETVFARACTRARQRLF